MQKFNFLFICSLFLFRIVIAQHGPGNPVSHSNGKELIKLHFYGPSTHEWITRFAKANGSFSLSDPKGFLFRGHLKNHHLHGAWQSWFENGNILDSGFFFKGIPDGTWKVWNQQGALIAVRTYDADLYQRIFRELQLNHPKIYHYPITGLYKKKGPSVMDYLSAHYSFPAHTDRDEPLGETIRKNRNSPYQYHPIFQQCLHHGLYVNYLPDGRLKDSGYYKQGLKSGIWVHFQSQTGLLWKGHYKNGFPQKEWKAYNVEGNLQELLFYNEEGKLQWRKKYKSAP